MTPRLEIRSFSNDQFFLDKVFYSNFYRLKGYTENKPVVVDIGAHCGYFSFAALTLGASKVYAFEPFIENFKILLDNVCDSPLGIVVPYQLGVYTKSTSLTMDYPQLTKSSYYDYGYLSMDGEGTRKFRIVCFDLDYLLDTFVDEKIDILKICIGYAEREILMAAKNFQNIENICGEISLSEEETSLFKNFLLGHGFVDFQVHPMPDDNRSYFVTSKLKISDRFLPAVNFET